VRKLRPINGAKINCVTKWKENSLDPGLEILGNPGNGLKWDPLGPNRDPKPPREKFQGWKNPGKGPKP